MSTVTERIGQVTQPKGGYLNLSLFDYRKTDDHCKLNESENIHGSVAGMVVDYLTRLCLGAKPLKAFQIPCMGAMIAEKKFGQMGALDDARGFFSHIHGSDKESVINACKLVSYDIWFRNPAVAAMAKSADDINPDDETVQNIQLMIQRSLAFWLEHGPVTKDGFTFEPRGYTSTVDSGDGDYLTKDSLWDFKVLKSKPTSKHTLQILMYWIMGQHSGQDIFKCIKKIGIFNPRTNCSYQLNVDAISPDIISEVETNVIGY